MSKPTAEDIERQLEDAIAMARRMGFRVAPGEWGIHASKFEAGEFTWQPDDPGQPYLCPMACVVMGAPAKSAFSSEAEAAADKLALSVHEVYDFITGFDNLDLEPNWRVSEAFYQMGRRLREKVMAESGVTP